jgi:CubicO group peptidase (beta-lactamase class C family)
MLAGKSIVCLTAALFSCAALAQSKASDACPAPSAAMPAAQTAAINAGLDSYIVKGMQDWKLPGLSIAVVKNGVPVYTKGFGVRTLGDSGRVDEHTRFGMMSTTKAMTALGLAMLVDDGKLKWDDPVSKHLPWFALSDPYVTSNLTVRDLLLHNSGLGNTDALWARGDLNSRQIIERLQKVPLSYPLRGGFAYQNVMYQVAGEVLQAVSGMPWDRFIKTRILVPIGMTRSDSTLAAMAAHGDKNTSSAHFEIDGKLHVIQESPVDAVPAAGAAWSTAEDSAKWLQFLLSDGCANGKRLLSGSNFRELLRPQAFVSAGEFYPTAQLTKPHWTTYGLGWFLLDYRGKFVAMHTGSMDGRTAIVGLLPDEGLGVFIYGNLDHAEFRHALMWRVLDAYSGAPERDWSTEFLALYGGLKADQDKKQAEQDAKRVTGTKPTHSSDQYVGTYLNPVYGDIKIRLADGRLQAQFGPMPENAGTLQHWHYDTYRVKFGDGRYGWSLINFGMATDGSIHSLRLNDSADFEFTRKPDGGKSSP